MPDDKTPVFTIQVGTAGTFTNEPSTDVSSYVNAQIAAAPVGDDIVINFEPGVYGVVKPILLRSNTDVIGNDSTVQPLTSNGWQSNTGIFVNADAYSLNSTQTYVKNVDGTSTILTSTPNTTNVMGSTSTGVIDTNISVQGMTFNDSGRWIFGTWFINATNIDVQNNTYIGGGDGNAFVDVVNGIVANNLAVGQVNAAYDNWDGPTNITIEDNSTYMTGAPTCGWSVLINSCPSGNPSNPGNASNDGVVDNTFSGYWINGSSGNADPLENYGFTTESNITQQGNLVSSLNVPEAGSFYSANVVAKDVVQDDLFSGINYPASDTSFVIGAFSSSGSLASNADISGNLIIGASNQNNGAPLIENIGNSPTTTNNAILGSSIGNNAISTSDLNGTSSSFGNIIMNGNLLGGDGVIPGLIIASPPTLFMSPGSSTAISGISISDTNVGSSLCVTIDAIFGTLSFLDNVLGNLVWGSADGAESLTLTGSLAEINVDLSALSYSSPADGWDDSIEINVSDGSGQSATRYVSVLETAGTSVSELTILPAGSMGSLAVEGLLYPGATLLPEPSLNGEIAIASSGDNFINMGSTISAAFLGVGSNTIEGGNDQEYVVTGSGTATLNLVDGGDITVAAGAGTVNVDAATGDNLIEVGSSTAVIDAGSGSNTVAGGLGEATIVGGRGSLYIATLPQDGGSIDISLGTGASTVLALSGDCSISTGQGVSNLIYTGIGANLIKSAGNDTIYAGAGSTTVLAGANAADIVFQGTGSLAFVSESSGTSTIVAGSGNTNVTTSGGNVCVDVTAEPGANRTLAINGFTTGIYLSEGLSVASQSIVGTTARLLLSDGTSVQLLDPLGQAVVDLEGVLSLTTNTITLLASSYFNLDNQYLDGQPWSIFGSSGGNDTINTPVPGALITTSGTGNVVGLEAVNATVMSGGSADLLTAFNGENVISIAGSGSSVLIRSGSDTVYAAPGSNLTNLFFIGSGGGQLNFINQSAYAASVTGGADGASGSVTAFGGAGGGYYQGGAAGNNVLMGGSGSSATTLVGAGTGNFLSVGGSGSNALYAGDGNATLIAGFGTRDNIFQGGIGTDVVSSNGSGSQSFFVGVGGSETISGSTISGAVNRFYFDQTAASGGGTAVIWNFNVGHDAGYVNPGLEMQPSVVISEVAGLFGNTEIYLSNNTSIMLIGKIDTQFLSVVGGTSF